MQEVMQLHDDEIDRMEECELHRVFLKSLQTAFEHTRSIVSFLNRPEENPGERIPFLVLLGIHVLLLPPPIRHAVSHSVGHVVEHILEHHGEGFSRAANVTLWGFLFAIPVALLPRLWWIAADAALALLLLYRLFDVGPNKEH